MASIRKGGRSWQARVIRKGFPAEARSFSTKEEAERWCRSVESAMDSGRFVNTREAERTLLRDVLQRYAETVTPLKRGAEDEVIRLRALTRLKMAALSVSNVTPPVIA